MAEYQISSDVKLNKVAKFGRRNKKGVRYLNCACSYDIETSSFILHGQKCANMYVWAFAFEDTIIIGRTWTEFLILIDKFRALYQLDPNNRMIVYVHNLGYEFQFFRHYFNWISVFASAVREPIYAVTENGIEFRCSLIASGYSLEALASVIGSTNKKVGDLDYSLIRHRLTPLTDREIGYLSSDVQIVIAWIRYKCIDCGRPSNIPLTATGNTRRLCKQKTIYGYDRENYIELMKSLTLDPESYRQLKRAFQGGFTHSNPCKTDITLTDISSYDICSSYPAQMVANHFPMSAPQLIEIRSKADFEKYLNDYCCVFDVEFINIQSTIIIENYLSSHKCFLLEDPEIVNGRVRKASTLRTTITNVDYEIIKRVYKWDSIRVSNFRIYKRGYLPKPFLNAVIELYEKKTSLKNVENFKREYNSAKELLNACFGMCCTDIVREDISYSDDWEVQDVDVGEKIDEYNNSNSRFLFYPWGVFITAYARKQLYNAILELKEDYVYSDTDSVKFQNLEKHEKFFADYNNYITDKIDLACFNIGINPERCRPETKNGDRKQMGVWEFEGTADKFKTLGAKRYFYLKDGEYHLTCAGMHKIKGAEFLAKQKSPFNSFCDKMKIEGDYTGKLTHTYIDEPRSGMITDYLGNKCGFSELSAVHLEPAGYSLKMSDVFVRYITKVKERNGGIE